MKANNQNISNALGIAYNITPVANNTTAVVLEDSVNKVDDDYEFARRNLYDIIERGQEALTDMIDFAKQAQHPRAYEVVGNLINNLVDANQKLLHLSKQVKDITAKIPSDDDKKTINNNLFVGSTAELQKLLKGE
jgi:Terminase DNA packaging enzyme